MLLNCSAALPTKLIMLLLLLLRFRAAISVAEHENISSYYVQEGLRNTRVESRLKHDGAHGAPGSGAVAVKLL
jgi:hypothetical protein